jgi:hypothetical protein
MYLYNTTFKVALDKIHEFKLYITEFCEEEETKKYVSKSQLFKLLGVEEREGFTFSLQFLIQDIETFNMFVVVIDSKLKNEINNTFGDKVVYFSTLMQKQ